MKICWLGWRGFGMIESSSGLMQYDPNMTSYIIGYNNKSNSGGEDIAHCGTMKNIKIFSTTEQLLRDLEEFDVIVYDTYIYSKDDLPGLIISLMPNEEEFIKSAQWKNLKAKKILWDGESVTGKNWHFIYQKYFDFTITNNPLLKGYYDYCSIDPNLYTDTGDHTRFNVIYGGSNLCTGYRKQLYDLLSQDKRNLCHSITIISNWIWLLNNSRMCLSTSSCASGDKWPMCIKEKDSKVLLCGALPITEEFADTDQFLEPGKERVTFTSMSDLLDKILYYETHEDDRKRIVEAGKKKVIASLTNNKRWQKAFKAFGFIK